MLVRTNYQAIPVDVRRKSAAIVRQRCYDMLSNPMLSQDQRDWFTGQLLKIAKWEAGSL